MAAKKNLPPPPATLGLYPVGTMLSLAGTINESALKAQGWLYCNGNTVSRTTYSALYEVIGNAFGDGDGTSTFNLPDARGRFLRGTDNGAGVDPDSANRTANHPGGNTGNNVGSVQGYATAKPTVAFTATTAGNHCHTVANIPKDKSSYAVAGSYQAIWNGKSATTDSAGSHCHSVIGGDLETVAKNVCSYIIIKFQDVPHTE
jgi:microcystin-dependent protein